MNRDTVEGLLDGYARWYRDSFSVIEESGGCRIVTPMLDRSNDHMSIHMSRTKEGLYLLTDLGATVGDLAMCGCDILGSKTRSEKLSDVLRGFGLDSAGDEIYVTADDSNIFNAINMLMQGMASVDDLFFTVKESVRGHFSEDVAAWLSQNGIRFVPDITMTGRSGFSTKFDYLIAGSPDGIPERYIKTVSAPSESTIRNAIFGWDDIKEARGQNTAGYLFMNGANTSSGTIPKNLVDACRAYKVTPVDFFNIPDSVRSELAA